MPASDARLPLPYTFGNHMHWVDMQWLWGYDVLPDSIDDMLALCRAVGARANVNFDAVGYERLAAEAPEALGRLRAAVHEGTVEVVGGSYGQPYGLFLGGESNVRQRVFGARTVRRLLGVWPRTFWEEEFDFFPQLPQILAGCGFTGASLFFQWTWHTPTVPEEDVPLVLWEGVDGTRLPAVTKTALCLHQWPEDFDGRLETALRVEHPALVQWLELMPSPDWMCRSEVLLPRLRELFADERFAIEPVTLGELVRRLAGGDPPVRRYTMDEVFHGMTLGKNADRAPRASDHAEASILSAESLAATTGLLGRPYASWDVYPAWELDEAWRGLLAAQHHDNHECEGLCGSIGAASLEHAHQLADGVRSRHLRHVARHVAVGGERLVVHNPLGWTRDIVLPPIDDWGDGPEVAGRRVRSVPAFGWATLRDEDDTVIPDGARTERRDGGIELHHGDLTARFDAGTGRGTALRCGAVDLPAGFGTLRMERAGAAVDFSAPEVDAGDGCLTVHSVDDGHDVELHYTGHGDHLHLVVIVWRLPRPDGGYRGALRLAVDGLEPARVRADTPFAVEPVAPRGEHVRKYPGGDWMTSEQWFEPVRGAFTARSFVDLERPDGTGLLCVHDGSQGMFRTGSGIEIVLGAYDPWDEDRWADPQEEPWFLHFDFAPHGPWTDARRVRRACELRADLEVEFAGGPGGRAPTTFGMVHCPAENVVLTACHREHRKAFEHVDGAFGPDVRNPFVVRLVEYDGTATDTRLVVPAPCPLAARTDLLGAVLEELTPAPCPAPPWSDGERDWVAVPVSLRPHEIATVMLDLEAGRHVPRNLDEHRRVWATVHRR